jgi:hypothetical protein
MSFPCIITTHKFNGSVAVVEICDGAKENKERFSDETVVALVGLGNTIRKIRARLLSEKCIPPKGIIKKKPDAKK